MEKKKKKKDVGKKMKKDVDFIETLT